MLLFVLIYVAMCADPCCCMCCLVSLYVLIYVLIHVADCGSNAVLVRSNVCTAIVVMSVALECCTVCSNNRPYC